MERDKTLVRQMQREVERQCKFAMISFQDIEESSANGDGNLFWYSAQSLLFSLDRISNLLWPPDEGSPGRGEGLRESLGVSDESPLANDGFISRFLDFAGRIEEWYETSENRRFFDSYTEPLDILAETTASDRFRGYDVERNALLMHGEYFHLDPVAEAVETLARKAEAEMAKPRFDLGG